MHFDKTEVPKAAAQAKLALLTMYGCLIFRPTVGFHSIFRTPQSAELTATYTIAFAAKCHGSMLICVLEAFMLPLPRAKSEWLETA